MTSSPVFSSGKRGEEISAVNDWLSVELARERNARILAEAEERRLARLVPLEVGPDRAAGTGGEEDVPVRSGAGERRDLARRMGEAGGAASPVTRACLRCGVNSGFPGTIPSGCSTALASPLAVS